MKKIIPIPYQNNAKNHPAPQIYKIALSIKNFGWQQPIVVDKDNVIIVGHGRWLGYEKYKDEMNLPEPRIEVAEDLTEEQVRAYRLADNLTASTEYNMDIVLEESKQLSLGLQEIIEFQQTGETKKGKEQEEQFIHEEGYLEYLNQGIRQIVLHYEQEAYNELLPKVEELLKRYKFDTNSELFKKLVEEHFS